MTAVVTDGKTNVVSQLTVFVTDVNEAPSAPSTVVRYVAENMPVGYNLERTFGGGFNVCAPDEDAGQVRFVKPLSHYQPRA